MSDRSIFNQTDWRSEDEQAIDNETYAEFVRAIQEERGFGR